MSKHQKTEDLLEKIAEKIHDHWMIWAKELLEKEENISPKRRTRWEKECFKNYEDLTEPMKELDRKFAKDILNLI
ncbi:MAG: RyR domain-containing protein [Flavobacterium sp.]